MLYKKNSTQKIYTFRIIRRFLLYIYFKKARDKLEEDSASYKTYLS